MGIKVAKFGGSSLADSKQIQKVAAIIKSDPNRRYIIPSAPGKRFDGDDKITDLLYRLYREYTSQQEYQDTFNTICNRYKEIIKDLNLNLSLDIEFEAILATLKKGTTKEFIASRGEYLNGILLASYLGFTFLDASTCIYFKDDGTYDHEETNHRLKEMLKKHDYAIIPGFYGSTQDGRILTFSRGGSDITGSIVARAACAEIYENWTDVSGFLMADPHIISKPKGIEVITYKELRELSYMGATVLHEEAVFPVRYVGIPIVIKNTNRPEDPGTLIVPNADDDEPNQSIITGVAGKTGFISLTVERERMNNEVGFGRRILEVFERYGMCFEHLPSGIDTMSILVNASDFNEHRNQIIADIYRDCDPDNLSLDEHIALIAVVGRRMVRAKGTAARLFRALADANINVKMIDQGSCEINIIVGVEEKDFTSAIQAIYKEFVL